MSVAAQSTCIKGLCFALFSDCDFSWIPPYLTHLCRVDSSVLFLDRSISYIRGVWLVFLLLSCFVKISEINANGVDPDQTLLSAASDLRLHCLPMSHLWDARLKWVNITTIIFPWYHIGAATSENVPSDMCAQQRFRSDCAFAQSDQNLRWAHSG